MDVEAVMEDKDQLEVVVVVKEDCKEADLGRDSLLVCDMKV